jgi:hypothetical protein
MKKATVLFLLAVLAASLFAGCLKSAPPADSVTTASPKESSDPAALVKGLSAEGYWIFAALSDITLTETLNVDGEFHDKGDPAAELYRKLALYAQDANYKVTQSYTLTVPQMNVTSPNFRIQEGTVKGNIHVNADGFELLRCKLDGNLTFETQAQMDSAKLAEGTVTGTISAGK